MCNTDVKSGTEMYAKLYPETSSDGVRQFACLPESELQAGFAMVTLPALAYRFCDWETSFRTLLLIPHKGQWNGTNGLMGTGRSCSRIQLTSQYAVDPRQATTVPAKEGAHQGVD